MALDKTVVTEIAAYLYENHDTDDGWGCEQAARKLEKGNTVEAIECVKAFKKGADEELSEQEKMGFDDPDYNISEMIHLQLDIDKFERWITALKK